VDTGGTISLSDLDIQRPSWIYGLCYVASQAELVDELLRKLPIRHEEFVFVDLGSGKGRVLLIASHFPFQKVVGVELSGELHGIAVQNIGRQRDDARRCLDVTSTCGDAADYEFPDAPTVLYLYRPFLESVLATVLVRLRASVKDRPRPVYLVYNNPEPGSVLERTDFLRLVDEDPEKAWAIYSVR
jgi:SAM-dependent methyltransferase